ncbi:hypothetical protein BKM17_12450 [Pseudomonas syringae group genomosp. 3]|nr:hypothetical protein BKM17_12450 [Pseudomonas syringae group genomosp. 3]
MSKPFADLHIDLNSLQYHPKPDLLKKALLSGGQPERLGLAELWLSEGIPHAFSLSPAIYQQLRTDLSRKLSVGAKDISVVGSSRVGYSLAHYKFGKEFSHDSDLDLCVVNSGLYANIASDAERFIEHMASGITTANNQRTQDLWIANCRTLAENIKRGFVDTNKVPSIKDKYDQVYHIRNSLYFLGERLKVTQGAPHFKSISVRVYEDWQSMASQVARSLFYLTRHFQDQEAGV